MLGIPDPLIWSAYLLCILSAALCVLYGGLTWNKGDESPTPEDLKWAKEEKQDEDETF